MAERTPVVFADALMAVRLVNGVVRITFGSLEDENKLEPTGTLILPLSQFPGMVRTLVDGSNGLIAKVREAQAKAGKAHGEESEAPDTPEDSPGTKSGNGSDDTRDSPLQ